MDAWRSVPLTECIERVSTLAKIRRKQFEDSGRFPIVSQEKEFINGYWSDESAVIHVDSPLVVFGDHTQVLKYIDFDFVVGADGVKLLQPKSFLNTKYFYYFLRANPTTELGYARHYRLLKELDIRFPHSLPEQKRIVAILDEAFAGIATAVANTEKNLANARELFDSYLNAVFTQKGVGWVERRIVEVSREFGRGKSKHRPRNEPRLYNGPYPFIQTGDISNADHWLTDYTQTYSEVGLAQSQLWPKGTICIAIVGATVGETAILNFEACFPDSVIGIVVNEEVADNEYVEFLLQSFKALLKEKGKGTARDNINLGTFENQRFPFPALKRQKDIVSTLNALREETHRLQALYQHKLTTLADLKQSLLHKAFSGALTSQSVSALQEAVA